MTRFTAYPDYTHWIKANPKNMEISVLAREFVNRVRGQEDEKITAVRRYVG